MPLLDMRDMHHAYRHGYAVGACGPSSPSAIPASTARPLKRSALAASARQMHEAPVLLGQSAFPPLKYEITKRFGRR